MILLILSSGCSPHEYLVGSTPNAQKLFSLARVEFKELSKAEVKMLVAASTGDLAKCTTTKDANVKPADAGKWGPERVVRAKVIRWLCVDREARALVDPYGIDVRFARIENELNLSWLAIPFPLVLEYCAIGKEIKMVNSTLPYLSLTGSHTKGINANGVHVKGSVFLRQGFAAEGEVRFVGATIGGDLDCTRGSFKNPKSKDEAETIALNGDRIEVGRRLILWDGFSVDGTLSLAGARVGKLYDDKEFWPEAGSLNLQGFVYNAIHTKRPTTVEERLDWIRLQDPKDYSFQPYEQLAKVFRESGRAGNARRILIAKERDRRKYGNLTPFGKAWNWFFEWAIVYGYETYRVLWGAMVFLAVGAVLFWRGKAAGLMDCVKGSPAAARAEPASNPGTQKSLKPAGGQRLSPLVYSLDALVPVVKLHQEEYWLPNPTTRWGWWLRVYLWFHIAMGWILTTLAVMGLTGIVRK